MPNSRPCALTEGSAAGWPPPGVPLPGYALWGGVSCAILIGCVAGLYPAIRASRLAPADALRAT